MLDNHGPKRRTEKLGKKLLPAESSEKEKLASSLQVLESDRLSLLESIRELEKKYELQLERNQELGRSLNFQSEHISHLEDDTTFLNE